MLCRETLIDYSTEKDSLTFVVKLFFYSSNIVDKEVKKCYHYFCFQRSKTEVTNMFEELIKKNCFSTDKIEREEAAKELEKLYNCEIYCTEIDPSVLFAHHARGCTIVAAKICKGVIIYQNVTIGSNMKYNKTSQMWENIGSPIIAENVIVCDGAKILGPVIIGANSIVAAGAIITKDIPMNSVAYGINQFRPKDENYDLVYRSNLPDVESIVEADKKLIARFRQQYGQ